MATCNWNIVQMDRKTDDGFVVTVHYTVNAVDGDYTASTYGTVGYTHDASEPFTPYTSLTEDQVIGWVKAAMGEETVAAHEANVLQQIEDQKNPKVVTPPLPWNTAA